MGKFDDLRKQAEQVFGHDVVRKVEDEARKRAKGDDDTHDLVDVGRARLGGRESDASSGFNRLVEKEQELSRLPSSEKTSQPPSAKASDVRSSSDRSRKGSPSERLIASAIRREFYYGMLGLVLGLMAILGGVTLGLRGVTGSTSWTASLLGLQSNINDAAPGVVLFVVGIFFVWITRPKVKLRDLKDE